MKPTLFTENIEYMENYITELASELDLNEFEDWCALFVEIESFFKHKNLYLQFKSLSFDSLQKEALICYKEQKDDDFFEPEIIVLGTLVFEGKTDENSCFITENATFELLDMRDIKNFEKMRLRLLF
jgi:hypothetical protein